MVLSYFISDTSTYIVTDSILKKNKDVSPFDGTKPSTYNFVLKHEYHGGGGRGSLLKTIDCFVQFTYIMSFVFALISGWLSYIHFLLQNTM
jgi:hypothetical protein